MVKISCKKPLSSECPSSDNPSGWTGIRPRASWIPTSKLVTSLSLPILLMLGLAACSKEDPSLESADLRSINVGQIKDVDYDQFTLAIDVTDEKGLKIDSDRHLAEETYPHATGDIAPEHKFKIGSWIKISMSIIKDGRTIASTDRCSEQVDPFQVQGDPASNIVSVRLCRESRGEGVADEDIVTEPGESDVAISPTVDDDKPTGASGARASLPEKIIGFYVQLADDTDPKYKSDLDWTPALHAYQQSGANTLYFTFVNPGTMDVPPSFDRFLATRGTEKPGSIPASTKVIYAIGGIAYSQDINPWPWLVNRQAAEAMAEQVAKWRCDGIDLDIEEGAGQASGAGQNLVHFVRKLKELRPDMLVTLPVYGYPQIPAANELLNQAFDADGRNLGLVDGVGIMVYEGTQSLEYLKNYANGPDQWEGFPIKVRVPKDLIFVGAKGSASEKVVMELANSVKNQGLGGIIVWSASLIDTETGDTALQYAADWDASVRKSPVWKKALDSF